MKLIDGNVLNSSIADVFDIQTDELSVSMVLSMISDAPRIEAVPKRQLEDAIGDIKALSFNTYQDGKKRPLTAWEMRNQILSILNTYTGVGAWTENY